VSVERTQLQQHAVQCLKLNRYADAIALYTQCIEQDEALVENYWHLGLATLLQGNLDEAQDIWLSAIMQESSDNIDEQTAGLVVFLKAWSDHYLDKRCFLLAEQIYQQILELDPTQFDIYYSLGNTLSQQGRFEEAIEVWQQATHLNPVSADIYDCQGEVFQKLGDFQAAVECYVQSLEHLPEPFVMYQVGVCYLEQRQWQAAIPYFEDSISLNSNFAPAYGELSVAYWKSGNFSLAIHQLAKVFQIEADFSRMYRSWVDSLPANSVTRDLRHQASLLRACHDQSDFSEIYFYLGQLFSRNQDWASSINAYQQSIQLNPNPVQCYYELGNALLRNGYYDLAINTYQQGIQLQKDAADLWIGLGQAQARRNEYETAIAAFQTALALNPDYTEVDLHLGDVLSHLHKWEDARVHYQKCLAAQPKSVEAHLGAGVALAHLGKPSESLDAFHTSITLNSNTAKLVFDLMMMLCQQGHLDAEAQPFTTVLPVDRPDNYYSSALAWAETSNLNRQCYWELKLDQIVDLIPPQTLDQDIHFSFRFGNQLELPMPFVTLIPNGRFWLNTIQDQSAVITADNHFIADLSPDFPILSPQHPDKHPSKHSIFTIEKLPAIYCVDGNVAVLTGLLNNTYFHWMFDILPRFELLQRSGINLDSIDYFLVSTRCSFQQESLKRLGIPEHKLLTIEDGTHIQAESLIVPSFPGSVAWMPGWACTFLRNLFLSSNPSTAPHTRLYLSRQTSSDRRVINETEIMQLLQTLGFTCISLESLSVVEQAQLLAAANVVVAPHGSALSNLVFCNPGTTVIELFPPNYVYPCYWLISNLVGLEYYYLVGEMPEGYHLHRLFYPRPQIEDLYIDVKKLSALLALAQIQ
jgi:tetratricopeptide (TPR) repeat protein/capsular polysaccharide biosynthesis protein